MKFFLILILLFVCKGVSPNYFSGIMPVVHEVSLFDEAVECIKFHEGLHDKRHYPYVGYGHKLLPGERFNADMSEAEADSLLRADLLKRCKTFREFGKDSLLLAVLAYNVGEYRLLGWSDKPTSGLIQKLRSGNQDVELEYMAFSRFNGKLHSGLRQRREREFELLFNKTKIKFDYDRNRNKNYHLSLR